MSSSGTHPPAQQPRMASLQPQSALAGAAGSSGAAGAAAPITIKPFKICKEATAEQRRAERQAHMPSAALLQGEYERKWCSHNPFKPIWRPPEPTGPPRPAKRKVREDTESNADAEAGHPRHLELDKWLRHLLAQRLREAQRKEAAKVERRRRREESEADGKDVMVEDESESEEDLRHSTLQDRLLQAQARGGEGSRRASAGGEADGPRRAGGWGGVDGVRCRLHSGDRLQGLEPCIRINLFPGGYSVEGDHTGRKYDKNSKEFLAGLDRGKIPARKLLQVSGHSNLVYIDGCLLAEVRDYRMPRNLDQMPAVWTLVLQPDSGCVAQDLSTLSESHQNLNSDDLMLVEKSMLLVTHPAVCLNPSPHVAAVATVLHRRANRMGVWHERPTRSAISQFRRTFDSGAMRRLHAAVHVSNIAGVEPAAPLLSSSLSPSAADPLSGGEESSHVPRSACKGIWKGNTLLEGWDIDGDGKDGVTVMATALRVLKASQYKEGREVLTGAKTSHGVMSNTKKESRGSSEKAAAEGGSGGGASERVVPRNFFLPRQYLRDGMPPERQMRFRKDNQIVTIAIESKGASTYQLRSWLHEFGADGKPVDNNSQVQMPPQMVGNSAQARLFGGQLFAVYHREGWQCTGDSHQPPSRKAGQGGGGVTGAHGATSNGAASARPGGGQPSSGAPISRTAASPGSSSAGRGVGSAARGVAPAGAYPNNGPVGAPRPAGGAAPKPKQMPNVAAHAPVASPHMMAGRGAPPVHGAMTPASGQARAPMPHPGGMPGQQMHTQQGYRPPAMPQAPPQQQQHPGHHPHQVPSSHAPHVHQAQGVPPYHAAAGRGYMPAHHPQVAGRGVPAGQPGVRPPVSAVPPAGSAPPHQVYKQHPGAPMHHPMAAQGQVAAGQVQAGQPRQGTMPMASSAPPMQHAAMPGAAALPHSSSPMAKPPTVAGATVAGATVAGAAGRGQMPGQGPQLGQGAPLQQQQQALQQQQHQQQQQQQQQQQAMQQLPQQQQHAPQP